MRRMRRALLAAALGMFLVALAAVPALRDDGDDEGAGGAPSTVTPTTLPPEPGASVVLTTPPDHGPIESGGAAPVPGALLSESWDAPVVPAEAGPPCGALAAEAPDVQCLSVGGSGGRFAVAALRHADGSREARLYREVDGGLAPVRRSKVFEADVEVFGIALSEHRVGGEAAVVVDYDFDGSGSVRSYDVVAWDEGVSAPAVVAHVGGTGMDRMSPDADVLRFVGADYGDGAPTCCPELARVRTLARHGRDDWRLTAEVVPWSDAP